MRSLHKTLAILVLLCCSATWQTASAQNQPIDFAAFFRLDDILKSTAGQVNGGANDGLQYLGAYLRPIGEGFVVGTNNGWYRTAATHEALGFDISSDINFVLVPESLGYFDVADLNLQQFETNATTLPNVFGGSADSAQFVLPAEFDGEEYVLAEFSALDGFRNNRFLDSIGLELNNLFVPAPTFNVSVGIGYGTDVSARFMGIAPSPVRNFNAFSWGLAVKHDFKQWIPGMKSLPFDLTALVGYTNSRFTVAATPGNVGNVASFRMRGNALTGQVLISKNLAFFTPYAGVGFNLATTRSQFTGGFSIPTYEFNPDDPNNPIVSSSTLELGNLDPVRHQANGLRATFGARIKAWIFTIHGDYTINGSGYNVLTLGSGITFR